MIQDVMSTSNQVLNCKKFLIKPAKNKLTSPSKLYRIIELRLKRFMGAFNV